jgi:hypothetical protein
MSCGGFRQHSATKKDTYIIDIQIISGHIRTKRAGHPSKFQELQDPSRSGKEGKGSAPNPENHPASKMWMHFFLKIDEKRLILAGIISNCAYQMTYLNG